MQEHATPDLPYAEVAPLTSINRLIHFLQPAAVKLSARPGGLIRFEHSAKQQYCHLLVKGYVVIYRIEDSLALNTETSPFIFGLCALNQHTHHLALQASADAVIYRLPLETAWGIIRNESLWQPLSHLMAYIASRIFAHCTRLSHPGAYGVIRHLLVDLSRETEEIRQQESVVCYIQNRSFLSRSCIMAILSTLRKGSWLEITNGKLISIKQLPEKF
jgi:hypothetical protein